MSSQKITTIRLDPEQYEWIKKNLPNFSHFVREAVDQERYSQTAVNYHNAWRDQSQCCYPFAKGGYCGICWPHGVPDKSEWKSYREDVLYSGFVGSWRDWNQARIDRRQMLQEQSDKIQTGLPNQVTNQERSQTTTNQAKSGLFRRFYLRFFP